MQKNSFTFCDKNKIKIVAYYQGKYICCPSHEII